MKFLKVSTDQNIVETELGTFTFKQDNVFSCLNCDFWVSENCKVSEEKSPLCISGCRKDGRLGVWKKGVEAVKKTKRVPKMSIEEKIICDLIL